MCHNDGCVTLSRIVATGDQEYNDQKNRKKGIYANHEKYVFCVIQFAYAEQGKIHIRKKNSYDKKKKQ